MKNILLYLTSGTFLFLILASCKVVDRYAYSPATVNLLQAERKNDAKISANYSATGKITSFKGESRKSNGFDAQGILCLKFKVCNWGGDI